MSATTQDTAVDTEEAAEQTTAEDDEVVEAEIAAEEELEPVDLDLRPARIGQGITIGAALIGVVLSAPFTILALPFGIAGLAIAAISMTYNPSKGWLSIGTALMFSGVLISGAFGVLPAEIILLSVASIIVAWDAGQHAISLGNQIGRSSQSHRNQLVHTAATVLGITIASGALFTVYVIGGDGYPAPAVGVIIVGIVVAAWVLRK